ncbi:MAG: ABC transporter permease [Chloroflexota bacterium]|nr:ABC transporter permease [Chloroflexota bacterium]
MTASSTASSSEIRRSILSDHARAQRVSAFSSVMTFWWRALMKIRHVPEQMFDVTLSPIIFLLMFTYLFGGALAGSTGEYLQFVLPGILVMMVIFTTVYTGVGLNNDIKKGVFDRFRSLPIWRPSVIVGALLADVVRYTTASTVVVTLGVILGYRPEGGVIGVVLAVALLIVFASCLSWVWIVLGLVMRTPESLMAVSMMLLMPITFVSNVFVAPQTMPGWLESVVEVNPVTHLVTAARDLTSGTFPTAEIGWVLIPSAVLLIIFAPLAMNIYRNKG